MTMFILNRPPPLSPIPNPHFQMHIYPYFIDIFNRSKNPAYQFYLILVHDVLAAKKRCGLF